jgi:hypothetical protein
MTAMTIADASGPDALEREAARSLEEALEIIVSRRGREARELHRRLLERSIVHAERAIAACGASVSAMPRALSILARAHAAVAEDALHGAGQLSLGAQRAPTARACDEGWGRVATIVAAAEEAAGAADRAAGALAGESSAPARAARSAAGRAAVAAVAARQMLAARNDAYTFHTGPGFSFGEGWYVAAAALLAGVAIQIDPGKGGARGVAQAERFLGEAGLGHRLQPYRSRPRANKQTTDIVARAFRADPRGAHQKVRAAFLGEAPIAKAVRAFLDARLMGSEDRPKVLVWIRDGTHHPGRNTVFAELAELILRVRRASAVPVVVGDALRGAAVPTEAVDLTLFWKDPIFSGDDGRRAQLQFFEHLKSAHRVLGQIGVTTAGMDGPALTGMPTMYLTETSNVRMGAWVGAVPAYREIVREPGYLDRVSAAVNEWVTGSARRES